MRPPSHPFPIIALCISVLLATSGLWMTIRRTRYRKGGGPRCGNCDYSLVGLRSDRCPECGTLIESHQTARGRKLRSPLRVAVGVVLLLVSLTISWNPIASWWQSIYWYHYRTNSQLMHDLKSGSGLPSPANNPLETSWSNGWRQQQVDLARVALYELLARDKAGKLSAEHRHEIDELALANLYSPVSGAARYALDGELTARLSSGKLTLDQQATIYKNAIAMTLAAQRVVVQWDSIPIQIDLRTCLPRDSGGGFNVQTTYLSLGIDGKEVNWSKQPWPQSAYDSIYGGSGIKKIERLISYTTPGRHRIDLDVQIDIIHGSPGPIIHSERRKLSTTFVEIKPPLIVKFVRFLHDPRHEAGHYLPLGWLESLASSGKVSFRDLAVSEMVRRDRLGELPTAGTNWLVDQLLAIQENPTRPWSGEFGDYIEDLRGAGRFPSAKWHQYGWNQLRFYLLARSEIGEGERLPMEMVTVARRGNSQVSAFSATQWTIESTILDGVAKSIKLSYWQDQPVICVPQDRPEYGDRCYVTFHGAALGKHSLKAKLKFDLSWTDRPLQMEIPTEFDLGQVEFKIVPRAGASVRPIDEPGLAEQIEHCISISDLARWEKGNLSASIKLHPPPVDLAFRVSIEAGGREWDLGELFAAEGCEGNSVYSGFNVKDARQMPATGLVVHFRPDPNVARRSVALHKYWNGEVSIGSLSLGTDGYSGTKQ